MKAGVSTATLFGKFFSKDAVSVLSECDIDVCEIFLETFSEYKKDYAQSLKDVLKNMQVHSVHTLCTHFEPQLFASYPLARADAFKIFENVLESADALGAKCYTMHGKTKLNANVYKEDIDSYALHLNEITDLAKRYGVSVCLENVEWCMYSRPGFFTELKNRCPDLNCCLDIKQARRSGYDYHGYLSEMGDRLKTVHVSDCDDNGRVLLPGKGIFDFDRFIAELFDIGYGGPLIIEVYDESFDCLEEVTESLEFIKQIIFKRG